MRNTGIFAPQVMRGRVIMVAMRSFSLRMVRVAITPGMAQPPAMPPAMMKGITEEPCSPKARMTRSSM